MKKVQTCVASLAALILSGCADMGVDPITHKAPMASTQHQTARAANVSTLAQCTHNPGYQRSDNCCIVPAYVSSMDVDTAFSRAMKEYRFPTKVEVKSSNPERIYRYHSVQGQYHSVANEVLPQSERTLSQGFWLFLTLERETNSTSSVAAAYCEIPGRRPENPAAWHAAVQQSIRSTVPPK